MSNEELLYKCDYPNCPRRFKQAVTEPFILVPSTVPEEVPPPLPTVCPPVILPENLWLQCVDPLGFHPLSWQNLSYFKLIPLPLLLMVVHMAKWFGKPICQI
jgi:hypothetical protein